MSEHEVTDLASLQALTHPIRLRALSRLRSEGPATAAELGRALGESRGAMSYHLRQLERFGFVEDDGDDSDGRTRRWRATAARTVLDRTLLHRDSAASDAALALIEVQFAPVLDALSAALGPDADERWSHAILSFDHELRLDVDQLAEMRRELEATVERYFQASTTKLAPHARMVAVYLGAAPERYR